MPQALVGNRSHDDVLEPWLRRVGGDARRRLPQPLAHTPVGIVVEAVHPLRSHALVGHVTVPALPDGGGAVVDGVEPTRVLPLEEQFIGDVGHAVLRQRRHQDRGAQESRLQAVAMLCEVLAQPCRHPLFGVTLHEPVLQGEEGRRLHGVEDVYFERAILIQEFSAQICLCLPHHPLVGRGVLPRGPRHVGHHAGVYGPVAGTQIVPVGDGLRLRSPLAEGIPAATLQRLVAQPVGPLVVAVLARQRPVVVVRRVDVVHESVHRLPVLLHDGVVAKLLPDGPGHDDARVGPSQSHALVAILSQGSHAGESAVLVL